MWASSPKRRLSRDCIEEIERHHLILHCWPLGHINGVYWDISQLVLLCIMYIVYIYIHYTVYSSFDQKFICSELLYQDSRCIELLNSESKYKNYTIQTLCSRDSDDFNISKPAKFKGEIYIFYSITKCKYRTINDKKHSVWFFFWWYCLSVMYDSAVFIENHQKIN